MKNREHSSNLLQELLKLGTRSNNQTFAWNPEVDQLSFQHLQASQ